MTRYPSNSPRRPQSPRVLWAIGAGSLLLHGVLVWVFTRLSPAPTPAGAPETLMRVTLRPLKDANLPLALPQPVSIKAPAPTKRVRVRRVVVRPTRKPRPRLIKRVVRLRPKPRPRPTPPLQPRIVQPRIVPPIVPPVVAPKIVAQAKPLRTTTRFAKSLQKRPQIAETTRPTTPSTETLAPTTPAPTAAAPRPTIAPPTAAPEPSATSPAQGQGTGAGAGQGIGQGTGSGSGQGAGAGSGAGSGSGSGQGSGDGSGNGSGSGSGTGSSQGSGSGSGQGDGNGNGSGNGNGGGSGGGGGGGGGNTGGENTGGGPYGAGGRKGGEPPRHIVYVVDLSKSMKPRIDEVERELRGALNGLLPGETFSIVAFSHAARRFKKQLVPAQPATIAEATQWFARTPLDYGTDLEKAMNQAFSMRDVNVVVLITDGVPTMGQTNFDRLAAKVRQLNGNRARIDTIGLKGDNPTDESGDPNQEFEATKLLEQIAGDSGGQFKVVNGQ